MNRNKIYISFITLAALIFLIISPHGVQADGHHQQEWQKLNQLAEEALFLVQRGEFEASRKRINDLSAHILTIDLSKHVDRLDQANILIETILQARNELNRANIAPEEAEKKVLRLRLALDAVSHQKQPLWLNFYSTMESNVQNSIQLLEEGNRDPFFQSINQMLRDYEFIRPSIFVSHPNSVVQQLDSQMQFLSKETNRLWENKEQTLYVLQQIDVQLKKAFFKESDQATISSLLFFIFTMGFIICSVLFYVAFRMYKGEKEAKTVSWRSFSSER